MDPSILTGITKVDEQHQSLVEMVEGLKVLAFKPNSEEKIMESLEFLGTYVASHFEYEEELMREMNYSGYDQHYSRHVEFAEQFLASKMDAKTNGITPKLTRVLANFALDWVKEHIALEDKLMGAHYQSYLASKQ